jgi:uncharacterized membrane protein
VPGSNRRPPPCKGGALPAELTPQSDSSVGKETADRPGRIEPLSADASNHRRFHREHDHLAAPFGNDPFGQAAERIARFFGTPKYILGQTIVVIAWIILNGFAIVFHFDPFPFILLNLAFSTQAAYAAPLILLAQTRQAERDKTTADSDARHREDLAQKGLQHQQTAEQGIALLRSLIEENTRLTTEVNRLTEEIHQRVAADAGA